MSTLVKMKKDGETIEVSALVVDDHKRLGWKVFEEPAVAVETPPAKEDQTKPETAKERKAREQAEREAAAVAVETSETGDPAE